MAVRSDDNEARFQKAATFLFFNDNMNDFNLASPTTFMMLSGTNPRLLAWSAGDRVAYNSGPFGNPDCCSLFRMGVLSPYPPYSGEDFFGSFSVSDFSAISEVPEPTTSGLFLTGLLALAIGRRVRRRTAGSVE